MTLLVTVLALMTCIVINICLDVKTPQNNETDRDSDELLTKLLDLHRHHCGEAASCGSSDHVEPSEFVIPVPCCVPCSCLPSCKEQWDCCPLLGNQTLEIPMTTPGFDDSQEGETIRPEIGSTLEQAGQASRLISTTNERQQISSGSTLEKKTELDEYGMENSTVLITKASDDLPIFSINRLYNYQNIGVEVKCIRPQVFNHPNEFMDSQAYMMVSACPDDFINKLIIDKCIANMEGMELSDMIPVTSKLSGLTYKNKHCLMCNEKFNAEYLVEWRVELVSNGVSYHYFFFPSPDSVVDTFNRNSVAHTNIQFVPGDESLTKPCRVYDIISCNQTGLWDTHDKLIETICIDGYQLPIIHEINNQRLKFKNIACLYCNTGGDLSGTQLSCGYWRIVESGLVSTFRQTLNLESIVSDSQDRRPMLSVPYVENGVLRQLDSRRCPPGQVDLMGRCRGIICPRDHYIVENQCVPLYDTLTGLDLNIKIQITPSQAISDDISEVFVNNLKNMVDGTLSDTVSLQRRQVSLWYLPRSNMNPTQYYLLDVFFFSPNNVIKFSVAIEQIKDFFHKMKTRAKFPILERLNIKLNFQFKHSLIRRFNKYIDMSSGQTLQPLMKKGWKFMMPRPYITVSDVNWCFRADFDDTEIEMLEAHIFGVKSADIFLHIGQYDIFRTKTKMLMYLCIDLFIDESQVKEDPPNIPEEISPGDNDSDLSGEITVASERGLILAGTLTAVILLLVILYKVKKAAVRKQPDESASLNRSSDFVELNVISNLSTEDQMSLKTTRVEKA